MQTATHRVVAWHREATARCPQMSQNDHANCLQLPYLDHLDAAVHLVDPMSAAVPNVTKVSTCRISLAVFFTLSGNTVPII